MQAHGSGIKKWIFVGCIVAALCSWLLAQHQDVPAPPELWRGKIKPVLDTTSLLQVFQRGQLHGHFRYFYMATDNEKSLRDTYAHAVGGGIKYETALFYGWQLGISGFFVFNVHSADLAMPDPLTQQPNRYEIGLFDLQDAHNTRNIDRLEELYLKYAFRKGQLTFGKQLLNTPFINLQDGRMRPTEAGGIYGDIEVAPHIRVEAGYLYEMAPRSTVNWYSVAGSMGLYSQGVRADGKKSDYAGNLRSKGIGLAGLTYSLPQAITFKLHDVFVENIFNTALAQLEVSYPLNANTRWVAAAQYIRQDALRDGGNADPAKAYLPKGATSQTAGAKIGWEQQRWQVSLHYNRITAQGRYLMPREWGREPFFTFLPRERNEGLGDVHAFVLKAHYKWQKLPLQLQLGVGYYNLPSVTNFALNKYGLPSYSQYNIDVRYQFRGFLEGLSAQLLYVYKRQEGDTFGNPKYVFNKVNMQHWNVVANYHF